MKTFSNLLMGLIIGLFISPPSFSQFQIYLSDNDNYRGIHWDGKTAMIPIEDGNTTKLHIKPFDGKKFENDIASINLPKATYRGYNIHTDENNKNVYSYLTYDGKMTSLNIQKEGESKIDKIPMLDSDVFRGWYWDGTNAFYLALVGESTFLFERKFDGKKFSGNSEEKAFSDVALKVPK